MAPKPEIIHSVKRYSLPDLDPFQISNSYPDPKLIESVNYTTDTKGNPINPNSIGQADDDGYLKSLLFYSPRQQLVETKGNLRIDQGNAPKPWVATDKASLRPQIDLSTLEGMQNVGAWKNKVVNTLSDWNNAIANDENLYRFYNGNKNDLSKDAEIISQLYNRYNGDLRRMLEDSKYVNYDLSRSGVQAIRALMDNYAPVRASGSSVGMNGDWTPMNIRTFAQAQRDRMLNAFDEYEKQKQLYYTEDSNRDSSSPIYRSNEYVSMMPQGDYLRSLTAQQGLMPRAVNNRARGGSMPTQQKKPSPEWICNNLHFIKLIHKTYKIAANS